MTSFSASDVKAIYGVLNIFGCFWKLMLPRCWDVSLSLGFETKLCVRIVAYQLYSTKKLRKSQKTMEQKNIKAKNYSFFIYLFRYVSSNEKDVSFSVLALIPLLRHCVKKPRGQRHISQKQCLQSIPSLDAAVRNKIHLNVT